MAQAAPSREQRYEEPAPPPATDTVTVACSIPMGMTLYLEEQIQISEAAFGGVKERTEWRKYGDPIHIRGPRRHSPGDDPLSPITDGYALTFGVQREFMETWFKQNATLPAVKNSMIIMHEKRTELKAMTKERSGQVTGLEPINPNGDRRTPRAIAKRTQD